MMILRVLSISWMSSRPSTVETFIVRDDEPICTLRTGVVNERGEV